MIAAAIAGTPGFSMDTCELERSGPSFAVDTVRSLRSHFPKAAFYYFIGEDNLPALSTWKEIDVLQTLVQFVVLARGTVRDPCGCPVISRTIEISSTDIRNRIAQGLSVRYLLPEALCSIIKSHQLYLND